VALFSLCSSSEPRDIRNDFYHDDNNINIVLSTSLLTHRKMHRQLLQSYISVFSRNRNETVVMHLIKYYDVAVLIYISIPLLKVTGIYLFKVTL